MSSASPCRLREANVGDRQFDFLGGLQRIQCNSWARDRHGFVGALVLNHFHVIARHSTVRQGGWQFAILSGRLLLWLEAESYRRPQPRRRTGCARRPSVPADWLTTSLISMRNANS